MKLPGEGELVRWEELRMVKHLQATFAVHAAHCPTCHKALRDHHCPTNIVEATAKAYIVNDEERFCPEGRVLLNQAGQSGQLMMKGAI
jgi:hypothetical protein